MKFKRNKFAVIMIMSVLGLSALSASAYVITSCSSTQDAPASSNVNQEQNAKKITQLKQDYEKQFNNIATNNGNSQYFNITDNNQQALIKCIDDTLTQARNWKNDKGFYSSLSIDAQIWLDSLIETLETNKQLIESKIYYLLINQWFQLSFTNYSSDFANQLNYAINYSDGIFFIFKTNNNNEIDINQSIKNIDDIIEFIDNSLINLKAGLSNQITLSKVMLKHSIGNLLQNTFTNLLKNIVSTNSTKLNTDIILDAKTINDIVKANPNILLQTAIDYLTSIVPNNDVVTFFKNNASLETKVNNLNTKLKDLLIYICDDYYKAIGYGINPNGFSTTLNSPFKLQVTSQNPNEEDNGFKDVINTHDFYLKGLGFDQNDLNTKDIGLGFMKSSNGVKIYEALLRYHSNTNKNANQIFNLGNSEVSKIKSNMEEVARTVASEYAGKNTPWNEVVLYDEDGAGNQYKAKPTTLNNIVDSTGKVNLTNFFIWLNSEQWFNGRDMNQDQYPTINGTGFLSKNSTSNFNSRNIKYEYIKEYIPVNKGMTKVSISDVIGYYGDYGQIPQNSLTSFNSWQGNDIKTKVNGDAGNLAYKYLVLGLSPSTIETSDTITNVQQTNSISPEAAFVGTSHAIKQYLEYKDVVSPQFNKLFKNTAIDFTLRTGVGGAAYASAGEGSWSYVPNAYGGFYLDTNPYFGLQKWSMSSLANHESTPGHVYQFNYAHDHPSVSYAPYFDSTAYAEGWGLFAEWLGVQVGNYGIPQDLTNTDGTTNELAIPQFGKETKNVNVAQYKNQYDYANGAYWINKDNPATQEQETGYNSQTLYDAVQYFGFLNERQLRAMRCAVDTAIHAGGANIDAQGNVSNTNNAGKYQANSGWSLNDARNYLKANSGLGINDIERESKRYLEYSGQAVSYFNGTIEIQKMYVTAQKKFEQLHPTQTFMDYKNPELTNKNTAPLFDLILRNGSVPVNVLVSHVLNLIQNY